MVVNGNGRAHFPLGPVSAAGVSSPAEMGRSEPPTVTGEKKAENWSSTVEEVPVPVGGCESQFPAKDAFFGGYLLFGEPG